MMNRSAAVLVLALAACGPKVATVEVAPAKASLASKTDSLQLAAVAKDEKGGMVEKVEWAWSSSAPAVATVDGAGKVAVVKSGSATITATANGKVSATAAVEVQIPAKISIEPAAITLTGMGTAAPLSAKVEDDAGRPIADAKVELAAATPGVVGVTGGQVIATAPGTTVVTAKLGALEAQAQVTVNLPPFAKLAVAPDKNQLVPGATAQLAATASDDAGNAVPGMAFTWTTSDEKIATVDARGLVTAVVKGKATITAAAGDKTATAAVEVK